MRLTRRLSSSLKAHMPFWQPDLQRWGHTCSRLYEAALNVLYPPMCAGCGVPVLDAHTLCSPCLHALEAPSPFSSCRICAAPFQHAESLQGGGFALCGACACSPPAYDTARAAALYGDLSRKLVTDLKFGGRTDLCIVMARMMREAGRDLIDRSDVIVPVPLHVRRLRARGYNQSALPAARVARAAGLPLDAEALTRARSTAPQVGQSAAARKMNLRDAFRADPARCADKRILLIDDVATTGATADACAATLKRAGARSVWLLTFAKAPVKR